jgi:hypothetical protein
MDIKIIFLNKDLKEDVYFIQPKGFFAINSKHKVCTIYKVISKHFEHGMIFILCLVQIRNDKLSS